ncbi:hypothetical protein GCM10009038_02860 [Salinicola rhizosphaerae]|uniref:Uncharacterized protein n=1 Tax=Salinicola rhizosphaerae TaxID=1443141 RepID=A0ABQ3DP64_9GAMM|nr:hypothetical protein GCM10009038_02860 [Salinicola rhizosphaerae]
MVPPLDLAGPEVLTTGGLTEPDSTARDLTTSDPLTPGLVAPDLMKVAPDLMKKG